MTCLKQLLLVLILFMAARAESQIRLPQLISDGMVLQRDSEVNIWGWASPHETITCTQGREEYTTTADSDGNWTFMLQAHDAGGPHTMTFKGKNTIIVRNILFGDVWLCAGQSNMVLPMERVKEQYPQEVAQAHYDNIRNFFIPTATTLEGPAQDLPKGQWKAAVKEDLLGMGAVTYFFAKKLHAQYGVPIGIINASVGGTPIEAWISEKGFQNFPQLLETLNKNKDPEYIRAFTTPPPPPTVQPTIKDLGLSGSVKWYQTNYTPKGWQNFYVPGYWEDQGVKDVNGVVWFRKEVQISAAMAGKAAKLFLGRIVDADEVYLNGTKIGNITYQYPPRRYTVPKSLLQQGQNIITVRVSNYNGKGGFVPDKNYELVVGDQHLDLKGLWQYKVGEVFPPAKKSQANAYDPFWSQNQPSSLFNAMVAPITPINVKGFLWYQGESNTGNPNHYGDYLKALIQDMRTQFEQPDAPFLYVQLANFQDVDYSPTDSNWAELRNEQFAALSVPKTAMTVAIDLGEWNDIHPLNKKDVGERLALGARKLAYGENLIYSGPLFQSSEIEGNTITLHFDHTGSGLTSNDGEALRRFEIAGEDQHFVWANAIIRNNTVVVSHPSIANPRYVRYAWANNPLGANLYNSAGLPASPFRNYDPKALNRIPWQGKQAAVVLTYDDALNVHLDHAIPILDSLGLKGTFYVSTNSPAFRNRLEEWRALAENGHELGNHTLFHPCLSNEERPWVNPDYDMRTYSVGRMVDEIRVNNTLLQALDGHTDRTFAYTCADMTVKDGAPFIDQLKGDLVAARAVRSEMHGINEIDLFSIDSYAINGESGKALIALVEQAIKEKALLVFLFHGVGGEHSLDVSLEAHKELLEYLKTHETEIWTAPLLDVVRNINEYRKTEK